MNASSPSAVFHSSCLSSSTSNSAARQASVSNVGLPYSPFRRSSSLSSGGCALSLSSAVANPSFFHIPHRRRKHSTKPVFVVKGSSSTSEVDEERKRHGLQVPESSREREEHVKKGRVTWSPEGKATISWATQKQQDKASWSHEKHQSSDFGLQHGLPVPSVGEYKNSFPRQNQQRAFRPAHTRSKRPSFHTRQQTELSDPSSASRLRIESSAFQQAAEPDALGTPTSSVKRTETFSTRNEYNWFPSGAGTHEAPLSEEGIPQSGSVCTSKLEEILNNFRTRQKREEVWRDLKTRVKRKDDSSEEGGVAPADLFSSTSENSFAKTEGSPATPSRVQRGRLLASQMRSPVRKGSSSFVERQAANSGRLQSKNSSFESKARGWGTDIEKPIVRGRRTEKVYTSRFNQNSHAQKSVGRKLDIDAEDNVNIVSHFTSDSRQSEKALVKNGKASWHSQSIPSLPFELQYSYSEAPKAPIVRYREAPHSPFGPETLARPWTGGPPRKKSKKNLPLFDSFKPPPRGRKGIKFVQDPGPYPQGQGPKPARSRDEILGEPLTTEEIAQLVDSCRNEKRQLNLGRDGLTHNMLDLIHCHWKRRRIIKFRCLGVPTVDMDNVCFHLEDKTGGKIIFRAGGVVYLFRGRNYNYRDRPDIPLMLWKPPSPVYPKLVKRVPEGLTEEEADRLRLLGKKVEPLCTLNKNGIYLNLVNDVRAAFKVDKLVRIDCTGLNPSDYKKIGAKLKDLVPCVLLSFYDEQILMWKGKETPSTDDGSLEGMEAAEGFKESLMSPVESASLDMSDLEDKLSADVSSAQNNDSCLGIEEIQLPPPLEGFNSYASAPWSADGEGENATVAIDHSRTSSWSLDNGHASDVAEATPHVSPPEQVKNGFSLQESRKRDLNASSEAESSLRTVLVAQDEPSLDEPNLVLQATLLQLGNDTTPSEDKEASLLTEDQKREVAAPKSALALESRATSLGSGENVGAAEEGGLRDARVDVSVDDLWAEAIASGIAIQLGDAEMDSDVVVKTASQLAEAAPVGEEYTRRLMKALRLRTEKVIKPENELHWHIKKIRRMRLEKKLSKRPFRIRTADVPKDIPQDDGPQNSGIPVDELARLLSMR